MKWIGTATSLILAISGLTLPINEIFTFLFFDLTISDQLFIFGRRLVLDNPDRPIVVLLFMIGAFWFLLLEPRIIPIQTIPLGLAGIVLIITAYAVDPLFYGALFFAFLALIYVVLLTPPGSEPTPGVLRFLVFQILGILFILFAAWLASWIDINSDDRLLLTRSMLILGLGFSFLLAIFPFISWVSMIAAENHPFTVGFVFNTYFFGVFLFGSRFITEGGWIAQGVSLGVAFQYAGILMLSVGSILSVFSGQLGRITSALIMAEIGRSLLALSLFMTGFPIFFTISIIQVIALGIWSLSLSNLKFVVEQLDFRSTAGAFWQWPVTTAGMLISYFTLAGLPLLAGFPIYWALGSGLTFYQFWIPVTYLAASSGLLIGGFRLFSVVTRKDPVENVLTAGSSFYRYLMIILSLILVILGFIPQILIKLSLSITDLIMGS
jgi:formate hydrogenlyase subunit 3/multisubunit Na+/H+ antiporter MnhD subunit